VLHVDEAGSNGQQDALARIYTGSLGGEAIRRLPWVRKPSTLLAVRPSRIELTGDGPARTLRVDSSIEVAADEIVDPERVRCGIPGYDEPGVELRARTNRVEDDPFAWSLEGCAFSSRFDYAAGEPG
jgi:hypothetical protein